MAEDYSSQDFNISPDVIERLTNPTGQEPFAENFNGTPFIDEFRKLSLNKLVHLAPYSGVLVVSGVNGAGKTTLLRQFIKRASDSWRVVLISAGSALNGQQFLQQIGEGFGLHLDAHTSQEDVLWEINRYLQTLGRSGRHAIIVIDDAHLLATEVLELLEKIIAGEHVDDAIGAVLAVNDDQAIDMGSLPVIQQRLTYTLHFEPLTEAGTLAYIQHHLALTGRADAADLFSPDVVSDLYQKSGGWPGELNAMARQRLSKASGNKSSVKKSGPVNAWRNILRWGVIAAAAVAVVAVLILQDDINQLVEPSVNDEEMAGRGDIQRAADAPKKKLLADLKPEAEAPSAPAAEPLEVPPPLTATKQPEAATTEVPVVQLGSISGADEILPEPLPLPAELPQPVTPAPIPMPEPLPPAKPSPSPVMAEAEPPAVSESVAKKAMPASTEQAWLMAQPPTHFTMQLMALEGEDKVKDFIKQHRIENRSSTFEITRKGKRLTVLVYGSFASREEADAAARALPRAWGVKPWIRNFAGIHSELTGG